jgi:hypothetical protein
MQLLLRSITFLALIMGNLAACGALPADAPKNYLTHTLDEHSRPVYAVHAETIEDLPAAYTQLVECLKQQPTTPDNNSLLPDASSHHVMLRDIADCDMLWLLQCSMHATWEYDNGSFRIEVFIPSSGKVGPDGHIMPQGVSLSVPTYPRAGCYASEKAVCESFSRTLKKLRGAPDLAMGGEWQQVPAADYSDIAAKKKIAIADWFVFTRDAVWHNDTHDDDLITTLAKKFGLAGRVVCVKVKGPESRFDHHRRLLWVKKSDLERFNKFFKFNLR